VRCPSCARDEDRVVDSREIERRGRTPSARMHLVRISVHHVERATGPVLFIEKRSGEKEPFKPAKLVAGVLSACKNRPVDDGDVEELASGVESSLMAIGSTVSSQMVGVAVLDRLREWMRCVPPVCECLQGLF